MTASEATEIIRKLAVIETKLDTLTDHEARLRALERAPLSFASKGFFVVLGVGLGFVPDIIRALGS